MSKLLGVEGLPFPSLSPFPGDHDVLSYLTFSLKGSAMGPHWGQSWGRGSSGTPCFPRCFCSCHGANSPAIPTIISFCFLSFAQAGRCAGQC